MDTPLHGRIPRRYAIQAKREQLRHLSLLPTPEAAATLQVTKRTVRSWRRRLHNPDYLNVKSPKGRQWLLPHDARLWLTQLVEQPATLYGWEDPMWTAKKVQQMIERKYDISLSRVTAWNYLRRSNLTPQKPGTLYREQDPEKKRIWLEQTYPAILEQATKINALIFFQDETAVAYSPPVSRTWGVKGATPQLRVTAKRGGLMVIGAVSTEGHVHSWVQEGTASDEVVMNYLVDLKSSTDREVIVIMDNAPSHKSKWMRLTSSTIPGLHIRYLPPYSPELNPSEKLWRHLKRVKLKHHQARTKHQLETLVKGHMHWIAKDTEFLRKITEEFSHTGFSRGP